MLVKIDHESGVIKPVIIWGTWHKESSGSPHPTLSPQCLLQLPWNVLFPSRDTGQVVWLCFKDLGLSSPSPLLALTVACKTLTRKRFGNLEKRNQRHLKQHFSRFLVSGTPNRLKKLTRTSKA